MGYMGSIEENAAEIRAIMGRKNIGVADLAEKMGKSRQWLSGILHPEKLKVGQEDVLKELEKMK